MKLFKNGIFFTKQVISAWSEDKIPSKSATLAYYTIFSLTPIIMICIALSSLILGHEAAQSKIINELSGLFGSEVGQQIQTMIIHSRKPVTAIFAQVIGIILLIIGASGVFSEIQNGLNTIWEVKTTQKLGLAHLLKQRIFSFFMVLVLAFLLLVSLILGVFLTAISGYVTQSISAKLIQIAVTYLFSFSITVLLFAMMFKLLPDRALKWKEVWPGALITAFLFEFGKLVLGIYLENAKIASSYGASASIVVLLIWVYYTSQIFFIGAEITKIYYLKKNKKTVIREK